MPKVCIGIEPFYNRSFLGGYADVTKVRLEPQKTQIGECGVNSNKSPGAQKSQDPSLDWKEY